MTDDSPTRHAFVQGKLQILDPNDFQVWLRCYHSQGWQGIIVTSAEASIELPEGAYIHSIQYALASDKPYGWAPIGSIAMPDNRYYEVVVQAEFGVKIEVIGNEPGGDTVTILNDTGQGLWWRLGYSDQQGWRGRNISADDSEYIEELTPEKPYDTIRYQKYNEGEDSEVFDPQAEFTFQAGDMLQFLPAVRLRLISSTYDGVPKWSPENPYDVLMEELGNSRFSDQDFDANDTAWVMQADEECREKYASCLPQLAWKRPDEFMDEPQLISNSTSFGDVIQGEVGDCWLCGVFASLANAEDAVAILEDMFTPPFYNPQGLYVVKLFINEEFQYIYIDDRIPINTETNVPWSVTSTDSNELWAILLEKAFAKWGGSYNALRGGLQNVVVPIGSLRASQAITGATHAEEITFSEFDDKEEIWQLICEQSYGRMGERYTMTLGGGNGENGIVSGHVFTLLGGQNTILPERLTFDDIAETSGEEITGQTPGEQLMQTVDTGDEIRLVQVRNPWASSTEWTGVWSDSNVLWDIYPEMEEMLEHQSAADGTFWMLFEDLLHHFSYMMTAGPF